MRPGFILINTSLQQDGSKCSGALNRFSGFRDEPQTAEAVGGFGWPRYTPLKRGVNGIGSQAAQHSQNR